jgi:formin 2
MKFLAVIETFDPVHVGGGPIYGGGGPVDPGYGVGRPLPPHIWWRPEGPVDPGWGVRPPVDPGYGRPGWGPVDPGWGVRPPVDPGYGRPVRPDHIWGRPPQVGGGPIVPPGAPGGPVVEPPIYFPPEGGEMPDIPGGPGFWVYAPATGDWYWVPVGEGGKPVPPGTPTPKG